MEANEQKETREKIKRREFPVSEILSIKNSQITNATPELSIALQIGFCKNDYPCQMMTIEHLLKNYSINKLLNQAINHGNYYYAYYSFRRETPNLEKFHYSTLNYLLNLAKLIQDYHEAGILFMGEAGFSTIHSLYWDETLKEKAEHTLLKIILYVLNFFDMISLLDGSEKLPPELDNLLNKFGAFGIIRKGQPGFEEQQEMLKDLDDIEKLRLLHCSAEEFSKNPDFNKININSKYKNWLKNSFNSFEDLIIDSDFVLKFMIFENRSHNVEDMIEEYMEEKLVSSFEEGVMRFIKTSNLRPLINIIRLLGEKPKMTDEEYNVIVNESYPAILKNYQNTKSNGVKGK